MDDEFPNHLLEPMVGRQGYYEHVFGSKIYDPFKTPPDFKMAEDHGKAKRVYKQRSLSADEAVCMCCGLSKEGKHLPLCSKLSDIYFLGSGYALYFRLVKKCIFLLGLIFLISGLFNTISNGVKDGCDPNDDPNGSEYCIQDMVLTFTIANSRTSLDLLKIQMVLNLISVLAIILFFQYIYFQVRKTIVDTDEKTITPSDYTIMINGLGPQVEDPEIIDWVESLGDPRHVIKCVNLNRAYDIQDYVKHQKEKGRLLNGWWHENDSQARQSLVQRIDHISEELKSYKERDFNLTSTVFVSLETQQQAEYIVEKFGRQFIVRWLFNLYSSHKSFYGRHVSIKRAPEPTDIIWKNQGGHDSKKNFKRKLISEVIATLLILVCFILVTLITFAQNSFKKKLASESTNVIRLLSLVSSTLIYIANTLLALAAQYISRREVHKTHTKYYTGVTKRLSVSTFINTTFTTLFAQLLTLLVLDDDADTDTFNFYKQGGLLENMFYVFLSNAVLTPLLAIFDPFYVLKWWYRRQAMKDSNKREINQQQAHGLFEQYEMDISYRNAFLVKTMLAASFFAPAIPLVLPIAMIGLICNYWADKYILLRRSALPICLNYNLNDMTVRLLKWMGVMFAVGNLVFILTLKQDIEARVYDSMPKLIVFITVMIGVLHLFLPMRRLNKAIFSVPNEDSNHLTYAEARVQFPTDYEVENPITCGETLHDFIKTIRLARDDSKISTSSSKMKRAFKTLRQEELERLMRERDVDETPRRRRRKNLTFVDLYAYQSENVSSEIREKFEKERSTDLEGGLRRSLSSM